MTRRRGEDGVGVVLVMGLVALLVAVAGISAGVLALVVAHRQVQAAADLAALAGAEAARSGGDPCREAGRIAVANRVELVDCAASRGVVDVIVEDVVELGAPWTVSGRARAGPAAGAG